MGAKILNNFMEIAIEQARLGMRDNLGGPFGAVIVKDKTIISRAHNRVLDSNDPTAHAEIMAIRIASSKLGTFDLSECEIYTTSYPCPMCMSALYWARIKTLYYGTTTTEVEKIGFDDGQIYRALCEGHNDTGMNMEKLDSKICQQLLSEWEEKEDKYMY
ncbi:nucleoside deaminase [Methanohalophilus halophilus]|uniref:tRNA(Arg) A34 adenosine deaminase TadA n=2 Tax=Methanohalophilus halophilus TaxID=2177 RepID=A0A1H2SQY3_9EURY|nr:nucleoside deaminase [Methanohalophilus halophilus]SDW34063.1 tRNA(Arg) A34 adenosine deaminase TadA [Methanohalophilus halophilus]